MKYGELFHFDPIEAVIELRGADAQLEAQRRVETYVISDRMAEQVIDLVLPHLRYDKPQDSKGLLVIGNHGTGKSHLMSVLSAIAEHAALAAAIRHPEVAEAAAPVAGRFKVVRVEIGGVVMSLRDLVCAELEAHLKGLGITFQFPPATAITNNKDPLTRMMGVFHEVYPDHGLLLVVDELLDFLRSRRDQELILDLNFLREVGEICARTRLRFIAGLQESLFDNPRFQLVSDSIRRVKDRFEQVRIAREDIAYVVSERLLKKDVKQRALVREHLQRFAKLYGSMNEQMDAFVRLFPVHPAYIDTFERVSIAEKREVLKTLSAAMRRFVDQDVPRAEPGLLAYDSYWATLRDNPVFRGVPEIKEVIDKSQVLEGRVQQAFTRPQYKPVALRVIHALSVHRLTTGDIFTPAGATAAELRDDLCLHLPLPEQDGEFLKTTIEAVLREVVRTVSGQFISFNPENSQYYLDLKKNVDFDSLIEQKGDSLDEPKLDRYYFDALQQIVLQDPGAPPHVTGYPLWEHEIEWRERRITRRGYLFFGAPSERLTAQAPRDFYLYFLPPYEPPRLTDERQGDEVLFRLTDTDDDFRRALRLYAGARELWRTASTGTKPIYDQKAAEHLKKLVAWLGERALARFEVTYKGASRRLAEWLRGASPTRASVREIVSQAAAACLATQFAERAPEYPTFSMLITSQNRDQAAQEAIRWIAGNVQSKQGAAVLDALELLDGDRLAPKQSRYAKHILDLLGKKGQGQVLNRSEIIGEERGAEYDRRFRLEPDWIAVILGALVHAGDITLSLPGKKIDAAALDEPGRLSLGELKGWKHVERPKDIPVGLLGELFDLLGIPRGLVVNTATRGEAVKQLQAEVAKLLGRVVNAQQLAQSGLPFWGVALLSRPEQEASRQRLDGLKAFLESLQALNTPGKLKNFRHDSTQIAAQKDALAQIARLEGLAQLARDLGAKAGYLATAEAVMPPADPWCERVKARRSELLAQIASAPEGKKGPIHRQIAQALAQLKQEYSDGYLALHARVRLGASDDGRRRDLLGDARLGRLTKLAGIAILHRAQLTDLQNRLAGSRACYSLTKADLEAAPICPHCQLRPAAEMVALAAPPASEDLKTLDAEIDRLHDDWTRALLDALSDPIARRSLEALGVKQRKVVEGFIDRKELPATVDNELVTLLQQVLQGLERVTVSLADLRRALADGGMPCTVSELKARFDRHVEGLAGESRNRVRWVIE